MTNYLLLWKMSSSRVVFGKRFSHFQYLNLRLFSSSEKEAPRKGLLLGIYNDGTEKYALTKSAEHYNTLVSGKLTALLDRYRIIPREGKTRTLYDVSPEYLAVCIVGLGKKNKPYDDLEEINAEKETIRIAAAAGVNNLRNLRLTEITVESFGDAESAAEGAKLKLWTYDELKNEKYRKSIPALKLYSTDDQLEQREWGTGLIKADAQNLARRLTDTPANLMTPTIFAENATKLFQDISSVNVLVRNGNWAKEQGMNAFLSVAQGSSQPPVFLEICYRGSPNDSKPVVLVGKGITFDSGGINIKRTAGLANMRGDKGGAACVLATIYAVAKLSLPLNVTVLIPLCENMINGSANKPGDVVKAMNGKTVRIDNTDAEGRLILADALTYAAKLNPRFILDVATLTGAMVIALGSEATGVFSNSNYLWRELHAAGIYTGDRVWRFPLWKGYTKGLVDHPSVDLTNVRSISDGGACSAAAFLRQFVPPVEWMHLDIAGVIGPTTEIKYLSPGMTGRPTRTLIQFLRNLKVVYKTSPKTNQEVTKCE